MHSADAFGHFNWNPTETFQRNQRGTFQLPSHNLTYVIYLHRTDVQNSQLLPRGSYSRIAALLTPQRNCI